MLPLLVEAVLLHDPTSIAHHNLDSLEACRVEPDVEPDAAWFNVYGCGLDLGVGISNIYQLYQSECKAYGLKLVGWLSGCV